MINNKIENIITGYKKTMEKSYNYEWYTHSLVFSLYDIQDLLIRQLKDTLKVTNHKTYTKHVSDMLISLERNQLEMNREKYKTPLYSYFFTDKYIYQIVLGMYNAYLLKSPLIPDRLFTNLIYY